MKPLVAILIMCTAVMATSCNRADGNTLRQEYVVGVWTSIFKETSFSGIDTLRFCKDSVLINSKEVNYRFSDSDFDISIRFRSHAVGRWHLKGDSIFIKYAGKGPEIAFDRESFKVTPTKEGADISVLASMEDDMFHKVCKFIDDNISNEYLSMSQDSISLGKIVRVSQNQLTITNANRPYTLTKVL